MYEWFDPFQMRDSVKHLDEEIYHYRREVDYVTTEFERRLSYERGRSDALQKAMSDIAAHIHFPPGPITVNPREIQVGDLK